MRSRGQPSPRPEPSTPAGDVLVIGGDDEFSSAFAAQLPGTGARTVRIALDATDDELRSVIAAASLAAVVFCAFDDETQHGVELESWRASND